MMIHDLLQIQNKMKSPDDRPRSNHASDESQYNDAEDDQKDELGVPVNYSRYHPGYTTNHWLSVFRPVELIV